MNRKLYLYTNKILYYYIILLILLRRDYNCILLSKRNAIFLCKSATKINRNSIILLLWLVKGKLIFIIFLSNWEIYEIDLIRRMNCNT